LLKTASRPLTTPGEAGIPVRRSSAPWLEDSPSLTEEKSLPRDYSSSNFLSTNCRSD